MFAPYYIPPMVVYSSAHEVIFMPRYVEPEDIIYLSWYYMVTYGY